MDCGNNVVKSAPQWDLSVELQLQLSSCEVLRCLSENCVLYELWLGDVNAPMCFFLHAVQIDVITGTVRCMFHH